MASLSGVFNLQVMTAAGEPAVNHRLYTYAQGTSTHKAVYTEPTGTTSHTYVSDGAGGQYIALNSRGELAAPLYYAAGAYDLTLKDSGGSTVWTRRADPIADSGADILTDLASTSDAAKGDALIGVKLTEANSAARTGHDVNEEKVRTPADYSATFATSLSTWNTNKADGGLLRVPAGTHLLTAGATFDGNQQNIEGDGRLVSIIDFRPTGTAAAITIDDSAYRCSIKNLGFSSGGGNTQTKTAIKLVNTANVEVENITIIDGSWLGDSIGVQTFGRQSLKLAYSEIMCARPVVFSVNATYPTLNTDFYVLDHLELNSKGATRAVIEFEPEVMHTSTTIRDVAMIGGLHGIYWAADTHSGASYQLKIENCRSETPLTTSGVGYDVYLDGGTAGLQTLTIDNMIFGIAREGLYLRNCKQVTLRNCQFPMGSGRIAIDMTFVAGSRLIMHNCFKQASSTVTLTNARCVRRERVADLGFVEEWVYDAGTYSGGIASDVYYGGTPVSLAVDATTVLADDSFTGFVFVSSSEDISGLYVLRGGTHTVGEVSDTSAAFTPTQGTGSSMNIYWDAGTSRYLLENKRAGTITVSVFRIGTSA